MKEMWDKKASSYTRFTGEPSVFQRQLYAKIEEFGVKFENKSVVDIGCGTGVHTLLLAQICREITGMDISGEMLKVMLEDAAKFNISNLAAVQSDFKNFNPNRVYDVAFSTMSPAIADEEDFSKFINLGEKRVYLWWNKPRYSSVLELFYEGSQRGCFKEKAKFFEEYLCRKNIAFNSCVLEESREQKRTLEEMAQNALWHLQIANFAHEENAVRSRLESIAKDGFVTEKIVSSMKLLVF
ncbi:MAG: class I SAM-dependent methyltransferase [Campylobacter sp.]|uniref:class I SAM-dependent methyltransferase n=1 Tax=Campylobacter sp. TaxID=205 RepID=UPI003610F4C6